MRNLFFTITCVLAFKSNAQTYDELFRQKATQKKYLLQQIAALQTYIGYAEKGYSIASQGLHTISDIKHGDFNLHSTFFTSLVTVNPTVKNYIKVADIISMQLAITKQVHSTMKQCIGVKLTAAEINYLNIVFNTFLDDCSKNLDELFALITDNELQLKDDERIKRIDKVYDDMCAKKIFVQSFSNDAKILSVQRGNDQDDITIEKKLNALK